MFVAGTFRRRHPMRPSTFGDSGPQREPSLPRGLFGLVSLYRVRGWHYCHRPPLRTVLATLIAHGSSISNALFGGRGTATVAFCGISLPVQLHMTDWMHHHQIGHRIVTTVHHPDTVMQVPAGFRGDLLSTLWASAILVEPQLQKLIVSAEVLFHLKT